MDNFLKINEPINTKNNNKSRRGITVMNAMALFNDSFRSLEDEIDEMNSDPEEEQQQQIIRRALSCRRETIQNLDKAAFREMKEQMGRSGLLTTGGALAHVNQRIVLNISHSKAAPVAA